MPRVRTRVDALAILDELIEFFDNTSDVEDGPDGTQVPNQSMRFMCALEDLYPYIEDTEEPE